MFKDLCVADDQFVNASLDCPAYLAAAGNSGPSGYGTDLNGDVDWTDASILLAAKVANAGEPGPGAGGLGDSDGDGLADNVDNCPFAANASQLDVDADGFGNACDCDFNQDGLCVQGDALRFLNDFCADNPTFVGAVDCTTGSYTNLGPETDMNGDGIVFLDDSLLFNAVFPNGAPGPGPVVPGDVEVFVGTPSAVPGLPFPLGMRCWHSRSWAPGRSGSDLSARKLCTGGLFAAVG